VSAAGDSVAARLPVATATPASPPPAGDERVRLRAGVLSAVVGVALLAVKYGAWLATGSTAILADAMESIVNVVAALFALGSLVFAGRPADRSHPYGHGKIEFFSAVFEGGLIAFAAALICWSALLDLLQGAAVRAVELGLVLVVAAGLVNLALGAFLVRTGRRVRSLVLEADGQHVLSDFWTSAGVVVGLVLVRLTGVAWIDPVVALVVGANLAFTGARLVRTAAGGLLDEEDSALIRRLVAVMARERDANVIDVHRLRAIRAGRLTHADGHLIVPEYWTVEQAHHHTEDFVRRVLAGSDLEGDVVLHTDPCRRAFCAACLVAGCPVRRAPADAALPITVESATRTPDEVA
jgi:cation diffusion facilitator family transporter